MQLKTFQTLLNAVGESYVLEAERGNAAECLSLLKLMEEIGRVELRFRKARLRYLNYLDRARGKGRGLVRRQRKRQPQEPEHCAARQLVKLADIDVKIRQTRLKARAKQAAR